MSFRSNLSGLNKDSLWVSLKANLPLLGILAGFILVSVATGQFTNYDSQLEYSAASGVLMWGFPYMNTVGNFINQPPIGFYISALFMGVFGASYTVAVAVTTLFGVGSIILLFKIAGLFYGRRTALLAAAIFALTPWQVAFSRLFVIDAQCLFFSLLYLFAGILAIQRNSRKLLLVSGFFLAVAFTTKLFGVFMLIPLAMYYFYHKPRVPSFKWVLPAIVVPSFVFSYLWYQVFSNRTLGFIFGHDDFSNFNPAGITPSYFFVANYFLITLGAVFLAATALSLVITFAHRKAFPKFFAFDVICLITILTVAGIDTALAVGKNLASPYVGPIKYDYQLLPLFCMLAASLAAKLSALSEPVILRTNKIKLFRLLALAGLILLAGSVLINMQVLSNYSTRKVINFYVEGDVNYSFENVVLFAEPVYSFAVQAIGFVFVAFSLLWANKDVLSGLTKLFSKKE